MENAGNSKDPEGFKPQESDNQKNRNIPDNHIQDYQKQLRRLASELSLTEARERREIASDLHDHVGQALAFVLQKVSILQGNSIFSGMENDFSEIVSILDQTIRYTRNLTVELSPPILYELGLQAAIEWLVERFGQRYKFKITLRQSGTPQEIAEDVKVFMFKSIQELIVNVAKHAEADSVDIHASWRDSVIEVGVSDNGKGFDTTDFEARLTVGNCFGLFNIRERLSYIGGGFTVDSTPGKGTSISISAPYRISNGRQHD